MTLQITAKFAIEHKMFVPTANFMKLHNNKV